MRDDPVKTVLSLWSHSPGQYFCISTKSRTGKWRDTFFKRRERRKAIDFIKSKSTCDIYVCPHGFSRPQRLKDFSVDTHWLYADLDECNPKTIDIKPTIAIESSPGRYVGFWLCNNPTKEELNKRLTYHIGSDASGWDRTQVLRVPGTTNYKYKEKPKVKVLWKDGPTYQTKRLERMVPKIKDENNREQGGEAQEIYEEYESEFSRQTRKELTNPQVKEGKRSEVLWKLIHECVEIGMKQDEVFTLLWDNGWNKFRDRRGGERMLERQIRKAFGEHVGGSAKVKRKKKSTKKTKGSFFNLIPMSEVKAENPDWVIHKMIPRGAISMIDGDPGVGKSYFLMWICTHLCAGKRLPFDKSHEPLRPLRVVYFDTENAKGVVTRSRLEDNGMTAFENYFQVEEPFDIDDEEAVIAMEEELIKKNKIDVMIIDPISAYMGKADTNNAKEVRAAFQRINKLAMDNNIAVIVVRHLNKNRSAGALNAGGGSVAFGATVRMLMTIGWHPDEPNVRVVGCTKTSLSLPFGSLGYSIEPLADGMGRKNRSHLIYEGHVDYTSEQILGTKKVPKDNSDLIAADLIRERMKRDGDKIDYHSLLNEADTRSISKKSVEQAIIDLGLKKSSIGRGRTRKVYISA